MEEGTATRPDAPQAPPGDGAPSAPLRRSRSDRMLGGVCGGLGEYFEIDPLWFRIGFILLGAGGGSSVVIYLLLWLVIPESDGERDDVEARPVRSNPPGSVVFGLILIAAGCMILINVLAPSIGRYFWPLVLVAAGIALIAGGRSR